MSDASHKKIDWLQPLPLSLILLGSFGETDLSKDRWRCWISNVRSVLNASDFEQQLLAFITSLGCEILIFIFFYFVEVFQGLTDSGCFDNVCEFLVKAGQRSLPEAAMTMVPEAWEKDDVRKFLLLSAWGRWCLEGLSIRWCCQSCFAKWFPLCDHRSLLYVFHPFFKPILVTHNSMPP